MLSEKYLFVCILQSCQHPELIDSIVYKLYGLTDEDIKIIGESISGKKDLNTKEDTKL